MADITCYLLAKENHCAFAIFCERNKSRSASLVGKLPSEISLNSKFAYCPGFSDFIKMYWSLKSYLHYVVFVLTVRFGHPPGYYDKDDKFVLVEEMVPEFVVPDLRDCNVG